MRSSIVVVVQREADLVKEIVVYVNIEKYQKTFEFLVVLLEEELKFKKKKEIFFPLIRLYAVFWMNKRNIFIVQQKHWCKNGVEKLSPGS